MKRNSKLNQSLLSLGVHDSFWVRRLNTMVVTGNGAALVLVANYTNNATTPLPLIQSNIVYFSPFLLGLLFAALAVFYGIAAERTMSNLQDALDEPNKYGFEIGDPREFHIHTEGQFYKKRRKNEKRLSITQLLSAVCFILGIVFVTFFQPVCPSL